MFERFTEQARRVIFFARYEASMYGSPVIASEHLLLGLLNGRAGPPPVLLRDVGTLDSIRADVEAHITRGDTTSITAEIPLSEDGRNILQYAADSAEQLEHRAVEPIHLLIGILREQGCLAAKILLARGLKSSQVAEFAETAARLRKGYPGAPGVARLVHVERTILSLLGAWKDRKPSQVAEFFDAEALFADPHGDLWTGREGIAHGLQKFFAKLPKASPPGELTDLRSIRAEAWLATITWTPKPTKAKKRPATLRLIAVLNRKEYGWHIVWAHLITIAP